MAAGLTVVERQVLAGVALGETVDETAKRMQRAIATVKHHRRHVLAKLRARNAAHAVAIGYELGVLGASRDETPINDRQVIAFRAKTGVIAKRDGSHRGDVRRQALQRVAVQFEREISEVEQLTHVEASWVLDLLADVETGDAEL